MKFSRQVGNTALEGGLFLVFFKKRGGAEGENCSSL